MDLFLYICNMKSVGLEFEEKLGALADTNCYLNTCGDSRVYQFDIPAAVHKYFMRDVDDPVYNILFHQRDQLRVYIREGHEGRVYTNVYVKK